MPLKNPDEIPKIPKTRKKKAEAAIKAIPQKKPDKLEYIVKTYFDYDSTAKRQYFTISVETVVEFTSFAYEITYDVIRDKKSIFIVLMGLKAKSNVVANVKPARSEIRFDDLLGEVTVNVVKQDGSINSAVYSFNTVSRTIKLLREFKPEKKNNRLFAKFEVDQDRFTFEE